MNLNSVSVHSHNNIKSARASEIKQPSFTGNISRAPFSPVTLETIESVYRDYKKSLGETTLSDIKSTALNLSQEMQIPKKEVLKAMQLVTQFSNVRSLKVVSDEISKHYVGSLGDKEMCLQFHAFGSGLTRENQHIFYKETGINSSFSYVFDRKRLAPIDYKKEGKLGVILDEEKISHLETIKKTQPEEFERVVNSDKLKYFYISGWDTGIPVVDRTKSLEDKARELLLKSKEENKPMEKVLDAPLLDRIKKLGLKPTIIRNENPATELNVYNQMKPQQISKMHLTNVIEANTLHRLSESSRVTDIKKANVNDAATNYLRDTLCVYTPEKMSADLKQIHKKIMDYAELQGKDVLYVRPKTTLKSTDYVHYSYKKINNVDPDKFVSIHSLKDYSKDCPDKPPISPENTLLVFLDDCAISGDSISEIRGSILQVAGISKKYSLLFANLKGTDEAVKEFHRRRRRNPAELIILDKINQKSVKDNEFLKSIVGAPAYSKDAASIVFPYMSPDNNSELASNIALMHNLKYNSQNFSNPKNRDVITSAYEYSNSGTKTMSKDVKKVSIQYINTIGFKPTIYEEKVVQTPVKSKLTPESKEHKSFWDKIKSIFG